MSFNILEFQNQMTKMKKIILLTLGILWLLAPVASADQVTVHVNIGVAEVGIENVIVNPTEVYTNHDVDFTVVLQNTGEVIASIGSDSKIEVLSNENNVVATLGLYPSEENLAPGAQLDLTASWNTGNTSPGTYTARATIYYDNQTVESKENFTITSPPTPPPTPEPPVEEWLKLNRLPVVFELRPGETIFTSLSVQNQKSSAISGLQANIAGSASDWVTIVPSTFSLGSGEEETLNVTIDVPDNMASGDYSLRVTVAKGAAQATATSVVRVKPYPSGHERPNVTRTVSLNRETGSSAISLRVRNGKTFVDELEVVEKIPKSLAENLDQVTFDVQPTEIIEPDPVVRWVLENLEPYETRTISYSVNQVLSDYSSYAYWPLQQVNVVYQRPTEFFKITALATSTITRGKGGEIRTTLMNINTKPTTVTVSPNLPTGWTSAPPELSTQLTPKNTAEFTFEVKCPKTVEPGLYSGGILATYEGGSLTRDATFEVESPPGFQLQDYLPYLTILGIAAVIGVVALKWPRKVYREKIVKLLKRIKREASEEE